MTGAGLGVLLRWAVLLLVAAKTAHLLYCSAHCGCKTMKMMMRICCSNSTCSSIPLWAMLAGRATVWHLLLLLLEGTSAAQ